MEIVKLTSQHIGSVRPLFEKHLDKAYVDFFHEAFHTTYLSGLKNYHAYGFVENNIVKCYIGFYESNDDAAWYWTRIRSSGQQYIKPVLDKVIQHNEERGRLKFYSMLPMKHSKAYRRLVFSKYNNQRYDSFDEFYVPEKHQCKYTFPWQILYNRTLESTDTIVQCTFLKQEFRKELFNAGGL